MLYNQENIGGMGVLPLSTDPIAWNTVADTYQRVLGREPESRETMASWASWLAAHDNSASLLEAQIKMSPEYINKHPANQMPVSPNTLLPSIPSSVFGIPTPVVGAAAVGLVLIGIMKSRRG